MFVCQPCIPNQCTILHEGELHGRKEHKVSILKSFQMYVIQKTCKSFSAFQKSYGNPFKIMRERNAYSTHAQCLSGFVFHVSHRERLAKESQKSFNQHSPHSTAAPTGNSSKLSCFILPLLPLLHMVLSEETIFLPFRCQKNPEF